jgi:hypothetical protein
LALIRSFLIDSARQRALNYVVCAKKFRCGDALAANKLDAKCNAHGAKIMMQNCATRKLPPMQKALFHRVFLNFSDARENECRASRARVFNFDFDRVMLQRHVV